MYSHKYYLGFILRELRNGAHCAARAAQIVLSFVSVFTFALALTRSLAASQTIPSSFPSLHCSLFVNSVSLLFVYTHSTCLKARDTQQVCIFLWEYFICFKLKRIQLFYCIIAINYVLWFYCFCVQIFF